MSELRRTPAEDLAARWRVKAAAGAEDVAAVLSDLRHMTKDTALSGLAVHWHSRILGFYPSASARKPSKSGPGGPDSSPLGPGKPSFYFGGVDDFSPGLEGRVGDQFWHPQGVQVKAPNSRILISPLQWTAVLVAAELEMTNLILVWPFWVGFRQNLAPGPAPTGQARQMV